MSVYILSELRVSQFLCTLICFLNRNFLMEGGDFQHTSRRGYYTCLCTSYRSFELHSSYVP